MKNFILSASTSTLLAGLALGLAHLSAAPSLEFKDGEGVTLEEVKSIAADIKTSHEKSVSEVKELAEKAVAMAEKTGANFDTKFKDKLDQALKEMNELGAEHKAFEQKLAKFKEGGGDNVMRSAGSHVISSDEFKALDGQMLRKGASLHIQMKTITSLTTDADGSAGDLVETQRVQSPAAMLPERRMTVRDLLAPGQTNSNAIEFVQETGFTNNAGIVAEATLKPESSLKFDLVTAQVRKMAHWMRASSEIMQDAPGLASMIDGRLRYGLAFKEELQLLNGDGASGNLTGLKTSAAAFAPAFQVQDGTAIDTIRLALLQATLAEYPATGTIIHPTNWADIETQKDSQGRYIIGNPQGTLRPTLWSLPVVATQAIALNEFLTGSFGYAAQIFDRMDASVQVSNEDENNFKLNLVTVLAEQRLALANYRPEAFVTGDLPAPTPVA